MPLKISRLAPLLIALATLVTVAACAPDTIIRRSAFIPGPAQPVRSGQALERGQARFSGHINAANTGGQVTDIGLLSEVGDPGVFIPEFEIGASAYVGLPIGLELGVQFSYASLDWAYRNTPGVLDFPASAEEDLIKVGLGIRYNFDLPNDQLKLAVIGQFDYISIPQAIFFCEICTGDDTIGIGRARDVYKLQRVETEGFLLPNFGIQFGYLPDEHVLIYAQLGIQGGVTNIGFDNNIASLSDSTLQRFSIGYFGIGTDIKIERFVAGASVYLPVESIDRIDFGLAFAANIGVLVD